MFWQNTAEALNDEPRIDELRQAIHANRIHFPVPVPIFQSQFRPDIQWRLVELYFIRGWSSKKLADRYGVTARRIQQSLRHWAGRAMERGYLQDIPPDAVMRGNTSGPSLSAVELVRPAAAVSQPSGFLPIPAAALDPAGPASRG